MPTRDIVIDACCMLNLLATRRELEIVEALDLRLLDTPMTRGEPMFLWSPPNEDGDRTRHPIGTEALRKTGRLLTRPLDTDALVDAFVLAAARIRDTDASCIALAGVLRMPLLSDDRKERRIATEIFPAIELVSTLDILHDASHSLAWTDEQLSRVADALRWGGNFAPPRHDPRAAWYATLLGSA
jgi:hypothetical protein